MNWRIAFLIWLKGLGIFAGLCLFMLFIGLWAVIISLFISWLAIPVYATILWAAKKAELSYGAALSFVLLSAAPLSVGASLYLLQSFDNSLSEFVCPATFWIPLLCCIFSIFLSGTSIRLYLYPQDAMEEMITE